MTGSDRPRVVMLAGPGRSSRLLYHALADDIDIRRVIIEEKVSARKMIGGRVKRVGWFNVAGQLAFIACNKPLARFSEPRIQQLLREYGLRDEPVPGDVLHRVTSVNHESVPGLIEQHEPDAIVVNGTRIIAKRILDAVDAPFINTHMGITPRYRGVHGGYWALATGDRPNCGVTVHLVDPGIDTGGVLYQAFVSPTPQDGFNTYPIHQLAHAVPLMKQAIGDAAAGTLNPHAGIGPSRLWYHPTLWEYVGYRLLRGVK